MISNLSHHFYLWSMQKYDFFRIIRRFLSTKANFLTPFNQINKGGLLPPPVKISNIILHCTILVFENQGLSGFKFNIGGEIVSAVGQDVFDTGGRADNLGVAGDIEGGGLGSAVKDGKRCLALVLACNDIDTIVGDELNLFSLGDDLIALTPVEQAGQP